MNAAYDPIVMPGYAKERSIAPVLLRIDHADGLVSTTLHWAPMIHFTDLLSDGSQPFGIQFLN